MGKLGPFHHQFFRSVIAENILTSFMRSLSIHYALNLDSQHVSDLTVKEIPYARAFGGYFTEPFCSKSDRYTALTVCFNH